MIHYRMCHCTVFDETTSELYSFGGVNELGQLLNSIESYQDDKWSLSPFKLKTTRCGASGLISKNYIYICGGFANDEQTYNTVERLHLHSNTWENLPAMHGMRGFASAVILQDRWIIMLGGENRYKTGNDGSRRGEKKQTRLKIYSAFKIRTLKTCF